MERIDDHVQNVKLRFCVEEFEKAIARNPQDSKAYLRMGDVWHHAKNYQNALRHYDEAIRVSPTFSSALRARASLRATCPDPTLRNGDAALSDAMKAMEIAAERGELDDDSNRRRYLEVLAAAHAQCGDFAEAVHWQKAALSLAITKVHTTRLREGLALFEGRQPITHDRGLP